jgi:beta-galactosidase
VDLIDMVVRSESVIYVAHDDRLPRPAWLQQQFKALETSVAVNGQTMKIFERQLHPGESLTLGANAEDRRLKSCNMYIVFVKGRESKSQTSERGSVGA